MQFTQCNWWPMSREPNIYCRHTATRQNASVPSNIHHQTSKPKWAKPMKRHFQCEEQPWDCQTQWGYGAQVWQQNPWNVISNKRSNPGIAKHNQTTVTKRDSKTYEKSFPISGATLGLPNTIRLVRPSVTAKPMKRHFQCPEQHWDY